MRSSVERLEGEAVAGAGDPAETEVREGHRAAVLREALEQPLPGRRDCGPVFLGDVGEARICELPIAHGEVTEERDVVEVDDAVARRVTADADHTNARERLGEDEVAYWHTVDAGFAGRRPLPLDE